MRRKWHGPKAGPLGQTLWRVLKELKPSLGGWSGRRLVALALGVFTRTQFSVPPIHVHQKNLQEYERFANR